MAFTPFNSASGAIRNTGLFSKNTSAVEPIPYATGLVLSTFTCSTEPGTKNFSRGRGCSWPSAVRSTNPLCRGSPKNWASEVESPIVTIVPPASTNFLRFPMVFSCGARRQHNYEGNHKLPEHPAQPSRRHRTAVLVPQTNPHRLQLERVARWASGHRLDCQIEFGCGLVKQRAVLWTGRHEHCSGAGITSGKRDGLLKPVHFIAVLQ